MTTKETGLAFLKRFLFIDEVYQVVADTVLNKHFNSKISVPRHFNNNLAPCPTTIQLDPGYRESIYVFIRGEGDYDLRRTVKGKDPIKVPPDVKRMMHITISEEDHVHVVLYQTGKNEDFCYALDRKTSAQNVGICNYSNTKKNVYETDVRERKGFKHPNKKR